MQDAIGLDGRRLYEALKHLSAADVADLMTTSDGQAYVVGAHEPMMQVVYQQTKDSDAWHEKLAVAHERNQGPAKLIRAIIGRSLALR